MSLRPLKAMFIFAVLGLSQGACTSKEPIVDTGLTPPTDPGTGVPTTTPYSGANKRSVDRGWRLVFEEPSDAVDTAAVVAP